MSRSGGMEIRVTVDGTEHVVRPTAGDLVHLERAYDMSASTLTETTARVEHVLYLAWRGLRRAGLLDLDFDTFVDLADIPQEPASVPLDPPSGS